MCVFIAYTRFTSRLPSYEYWLMLSLHEKAIRSFIVYAYQKVT